MIELDEFELWRDLGDEAPLIIRGEALIPPDAFGTVVICHGFKGFAHWAFFPFLAQQIADAGMRAITFDFSGSGIGDDRENFTNPDAFTNNTYRQELDDLEAVISEARVRDWIEGGFGLFGHSRGGGVAIMHAAGDKDVRALVTWAAIASTNRWSPEAVAEWRKTGFIDIPNARTGQTIPLSTRLLREVETYGESSLNLAAQASRVSVPWLILHGSADETVPVEEAERLHALSESMSKLRVIEGSNHTFDAKHPLNETPPALRTATQETADFFAEQLKTGM
ncbi:MAG TPA: alpha/beta fold hydrolase [Gemmatimonadaceae bacterium]|nr:alpha/beta fold hydrolase [Gemmatimonadaceae bacterium]